MQGQLRYSEKNNSYSEAEQGFIRRCADIDTVRCVRDVKNGVTELVMRDAESVLPDDIVGSTVAVIEFSNQYSGLDALIPATYHESYFEPAIVSNYLIALTTIWIANFTKLAEGKNLDRSRHIFQTALLNYFFNTIVGNLPLKISTYVERRTIRRFGLVDWYFNADKALYKERAQILIDILHFCGLEYSGDTVL